MSTTAEWLRKYWITAKIVPPTHPGPYTGTTYATKFVYKARLSLYCEYKEHLHNSVKALASCFTERLSIDLETNWEVVGYTPIEIYDHIKTNLLLPRDVSIKIAKTRINLKVAYDQDEIYKSTTKN